MHFQFLDAHSRQTVGFLLVFVSLFYIFLRNCFLKLFILLVCLWGITLCQFWHYSGKWKTCLMRHSYLYLVEYEHFFRTSCVNFVYSFLITFQFSFWISFSDYPYWFVLLYPVFLITVYSCSTSPMCAVQCQALPLSSPSPPFCVRRCNLSTYLLIVTTSVEVMEVEIICIVPEQGAEEKVLKRYQYYQPSSMRTEVIVN